MKLKRSSDHHSSAQAFASFMVVALAGGLFILYLANKSYLERNNMDGIFVLLSIVFIGLLFALVYLVNNSVKRTQKTISLSTKTKKAKKTARTKKR
jgi:multisubunit Na+/H+ antiporter MnhB subunit